MNSILGIDYGEKRIGIAISDETNSIAFPYKILTINSRDEALKQVSEIIKQNNINLVIIGLPLGIESKPTQMSAKVIDFANELKELTQVDYKTWDETLTSEMVKNNKYIHVKKGQIDSKAAQIILQEYLDWERELEDLNKFNSKIN